MHHQRAEHAREASVLKHGALTTILEELADPTLTHLATDTLSHTVLQSLHEMMATDNLAILLLSEDHTALRISMVLGLEELVARDIYVPLGRGFAGQVATQRIPIVIYDTSMLEIVTPMLREHLRTLLGVPLIVHQQVIGVLHLGMKREYHFSDEEIGFVQQVADSLAQALERTHLREARHQESEELVEVQLRSVVELVKEQQQVTIELIEAQQKTAIELVGAQQRQTIELVRAQQHLTIKQVGTQQYTSIALVRAQLQAAVELVKAQQQTAGKLVETQQQAAGKLVETQQQAAGKLVETQQQTAGELIETQQQTAGELIETQQQTAGELIETQQQEAIELVEAQQQVVAELIETQQQEAIELVEAQQQMRMEALERIKEIETIFNAITDAIIVYDEQENILRFNQAARYLLKAETLPTERHNNPRPTWKITHPLKDEQGHLFSPERLPVKRLLSGERLAAKQALVAFYTIDDQDTQFSITGTPLYTQQGHLYAAVCILHDVNKHKHVTRRIEILEVLLQMVELLVKSSVLKEQMVTADTSTPIIQQIESTIVGLAQHLLGCSYTMMLGIDQSTQVLSPLAFAGFSTEQEHRLKTALTDAHLNHLIPDSSTITLLEKQEIVPFSITQSPPLSSLSPMNSSLKCYFAPIHVAHHLIGLLGVAFPETAPMSDSEEGAVIIAISKLCALAIQYEQQTIERNLLIAAKILLNEQMQQINKMQNDFISVVSHEFRTALSTIEGFSDLLRSEDFPDQEVKDYANDIYTDAIRLHKMVTDLLDIEQMKKGQMQMRRGEVDLNALLTMLTKRIELVSPHHTLRLFLDETLPQMRGDSDKLTQAISNVLSNAVKYSSQGGEILITSSRKENSVHVSIQDQGIGIAPEFIETIFTPYHRVNSNSTRYIQGTGLGLSLVREIIHLHEGTIWVESTPHHGSTFHFLLPLT